MRALSTFLQFCRIVWLAFWLLVAVLVQRSCQPAATPATCFQEPTTKPRKQQWRGFHGPAYLQYPLPRKPTQARLDSLARVMRFRKV